VVVGHLVGQLPQLLERGGGDSPRHLDTHQVSIGVLDDRVDRAIAAVTLDLFVVHWIAVAVEGYVPVGAGRRAAQPVESDQPDHRAPDAAMAAALAGGAARLDAAKRVLEIALGFAGEALLL